MKNDAKIMANLLKNGHKMLNISCPICKNPIFQDKNDKKFCPICNREVIIVEDTKKQAEYANSQFDKTKEDNTFKTKNRSNPFVFMKEIIIEKIDILNTKLAKETQIDMINKYANLILKLLKIIARIEDLNK